MRARGSCLRRGRSRCYACPRAWACASTTALFEGMRVPTEYDPLLAKIVVWGRDRREALARARRAIRETVIAGSATSLAFHTHALADPDFVAGRYDTGFVAKCWPPKAPPELEDT